MAEREPRSMQPTRDEGRGASRSIERFVTGRLAVMERSIGMPQHQAYADRAPLPSRRAAVVAW